jgi:hypothetical protein
MSFIEHTVNWSKGEILESTITGIAGFLVLIAGILFWKFGDTANAKALILPLVIVGLLITATGTFGVISNKARIKTFQQEYEKSPTSFVQLEKKRVEGFDNIFKYSYPAAIILVIAGAILFFVFKSPNLKAISLALMIVGLFAYFIDFFAAERADIYYQEILKEIEKIK